MIMGLFSMAKKKSLIEKPHDLNDFLQFRKINENISKRWDAGASVIPALIEVDEIMRQATDFHTEIYR